MEKNRHITWRCHGRFLRPQRRGPLSWQHQRGDASGQALLPQGGDEDPPPLTVKQVMEMASMKVTLRGRAALLCRAGVLYINQKMTYISLLFTLLISHDDDDDDMAVDK